MRWHKDLFFDNWRSIYSWEGVSLWRICADCIFFPSLRFFFLLGFPLQGFNEAIQRHLKVHKNTVLFFLRHWFLSHWIFPCQSLTRDILCKWLSKGECYEWLIMNGCLKWLVWIEVMDDGFESWFWMWDQIVPTWIYIYIIILL